MPKVYFNFKPITAVLEKNDYKKGEIILTNPNPIANVKVDDENYFAYSLFIFTKTTSEYYLVIKCLVDPTVPSSKTVYFAIPLKRAERKEQGIVDKLMEGGTVVVNLIIPPGDAKISPDTKQQHITVMLSDTATITVRDSLMSASNVLPPGLDLNVSAAATLIQQELDWVMSCDLLDENGEAYPNPTTNGHATSVDSANTITFLMMSLMIAGAAYLIGPTIYNLGGLNKVAGLISDGATPNHYSINIYWGIILILSAVFCVIRGALIKQDLYYFLAIGLILSYFAATSAILKLEGVANGTGSGFKNTNSMFGYLKAISTSSSMLDGSIGTSIRKAAAFLYYAGMISGIVLMSVGVEKKDEEGKAIFSSGISVFIGAPGVSMLLVGNYAK